MATTVEVIDALWRASRSVQSYRDLPAGLRRAHLYVLHALETLGGSARVTDIAAQSLIAVPNMTKLLKETEAAGWTRRSTVSQDRRILLVSLTSAGSVCLRTYYWDYLRSIDDQLEAQDHPEYDDMIRAIDQVVQVIDIVNQAETTTGTRIADGAPGAS